MDLTGLGSVAELIKAGINKIWPDKTEQEKNDLTLMLTQLQGEIDLAKGQLDVNKEEAKSEHVFISGGRPFCIWVGGIALAYSCILEPLMRFISRTCFHYNGEFPIIDNTTLSQVLFCLLGFGAMRSYDKLKGSN
jgi:hypothetical protein